MSGTGPVPHPGASRILCVARLGDAPCDPAMVAALERAAARLSGAGHQVLQGPLPHDLGPLNAVWPQIGEIGLARFFQADPEVAESAAPKYREMASRGRAAAASDLYAILELVFALREAARDLWGYDAILMPASAAHPWPVGAAFPTEIDGHPVGPRGHAVHTGWVNAAGLPGLAVPAGLEGGLPVGLQLIGRSGGDAGLLALAEDLETPFTWPGFGWQETPARA